jgi:uncharacterized membrane protein YdjX (TVP38/TMEM64 family)
MGAALATYYAGRTLPKRTVRRIAGEAIDDAGGALRRHGIVAVFAANMLPTPPFMVQGVIAGAMRTKLWEYLLGTLLSLIPGLIAWTFFGTQLLQALQQADDGVNWWVVGGVVVVLGAFTFFVRRWAARRHAG